MMSINLIRLWLLVGALACSLKAIGQEHVVYTDYGAMCGNLTAKFMDHCVKYGYTDMNQIRENMKRNMPQEKKYTCLLCLTAGKRSLVERISIVSVNKVRWLSFKSVI